jgi:hypothetical protein
MGKILIKYFLIKNRAFYAFFISLGFIKSISVKEIQKPKIKDNTLIDIILISLPATN